MANATQQTVPFGAITVHRVTSVIADWYETFRAWNDARRTVAMLDRLSPQQLDDIGLTRADIERMRNGGTF